MRVVLAVVIIGLGAAAIAGAVATQPPVAIPPVQTTPVGWQAFEGTWSATGQRQILPTESGRPARTVQLSGAVSITVGEGLGRGFRGEVIGFDDGVGLIAGRAVWTDQRGDRIFSQLKGEGLEPGRRFAGTISGGTGRYAGITGEYTFQWQYLIEAEGSLITGRAIDLRGRVRAGGTGR